MNKKDIADLIADWDWDFLKNKCKACWKLNKDRPKPRKNAVGFHIVPCPKHKNSWWNLFDKPKPEG